MNTNNNKLWFTPQRTAFTLVEMLIVGVIIVILAGLTLLATNWAAIAAKETKTRATLQKIDSALQHIMGETDEKFRSIQNLVRNTTQYPGLSAEQQQILALHFIRDTLRMEMPQSWAEVYDSKEATPKKLNPIKTTFDGTLQYEVSPSPLLDYYFVEYRRVKTELGKEPGRAALLFLIIQNLMPDALDAFHASEVADTDEDGLLEFVDAWGKPIYFLRWAPAFNGGDMQPDVLAEAKYAPTTNKDDNEAWWNDKKLELQQAMQWAHEDYPDPFDPKKLTGSWFLYPLVYSAGPDGKYDLISEPLENGKPKSPGTSDPIAGTQGILDPFAFPAGMPSDTDENDKLNHFDNLHNHQWYKHF